MTGGLDLLVSSLFDYAGTHPPASLSLEAALKESASFPRALKRPHLVASDMALGFDELFRIDRSALESQGFGAGRRLRICLLGSGSAAEAGEIGRFNGERAGDPLPQEIVSYEFKLENSAARDPGRLKERLEEIGAGLTSLKTLVFLEPDLSGPDSDEILGKVLGVLRELNASGLRFGLKLRGSGAAALDNPRLSRILFLVSGPPLPFKATAGLHHPIIEPERYGNSLGFLNLAAALMFARALGPKAFTRKQALEILGTAEAARFGFEGGLSWGGLALTPDQLVRAKESAPFTVGSCSLREPDEDLGRLFGPSC